MSGHKGFGDKFKSWVIDSFPAPSYMMMPTAVLDISPNSVKFLSGQFMSKGCLPHSFKEVFLPEGTIVGGVIEDKKALVTALTELCESGGRKFAFVSIPENALYLYTMVVSGKLSESSIMQQIEFSFSEHVPIPLEDAIYDFDIVGPVGAGTLISVTVSPKDVIMEYESALTEAGFHVRAIELEAYAVARAVTSRRGQVEMVVDIGYERAGVIIVKNGLPVFSITVPGGSKTADVVITECKKQYAFWDTRTNKKGKRIERIDRVIVTGGTSDEFVEPLQKALGCEVVLANVWQNLFDINDYVPDIDAHKAQGMSTLAGLLLKNKE